MVTRSSEQRIACLLIPLRVECAIRVPVEALAEACLRFSPQIALREGEAVFIEIAGSRGLFSEESLIAKLKALARRFGVETPRIGIARSAGAALALARFARNRREELPLEALGDFLSPFSPLEIELRRPLEKMTEALHALGISRVGQFTGLPAAEIASRFGRQACEMHARVLGALEPAWEGFHPPESVLEIAETQCADLEALLFVLKGPLDRAMARLRGRAERAARIAIGLELELWSVHENNRREIEIGLALPQGSASGILPILRERLARELEKEPLASPVEKVSVEIPETVPGRGAQKDFFSRKEEEEENWESVVLRLSERLGKERVYMARPVDRYLPEKAFQAELSLKDPPASDFSLPKRPSRLLKEPERLERRGPYLVRETGKRWQAVLWEGPERLSGEWWSESEFDRDYYRVLTRDGEQLWVFVDRKQEGAVYLHGAFD